MKTTASKTKTTATATKRSTTPKTTAKPTAKSNTKSVIKPKKNAADGLRELFIDSLKDIYWAEKALTKALPKMAKNATSEDLITAINHHLKQTEQHVLRLEQVFESIGKKAVGKKCDAMEGLIKEGEGIVGETEIGVVRDAGIIAASQKIEHYEIATYGTLRVFADTLGESRASQILSATLDEEKNADKMLTEIAEASINIQAAEEK
ncbi:ferritin-like domain-containing protein [Flavobacterium sp.]|uniref:YciE/YciF ferroxidase family protein n=1 Tax=Flavobacterium sp. TaxID=239 RepID=UPI0039E53805